MTLGGRRFLLGLAVAAASLCFALGLTLPFIGLNKSVFFSYEHSLISVVNALMRSSQFLLGAAVLVFAIFLPLMRLLYLLLLVILPLRDIDRLARQLRALEWLGSWSLQDVLVLSLTIVLIERQGAYDAGGATGIYVFAAAVLLMLLARVWLRSDVIASRLRVPTAAPSSALRGLILVVIAGAFLALGVMLPAIRLPGSFAGTDQHSLASIVRALYERQEYFPCFVLFTLAIGLPCIKLFHLLALVASRKLPYALRSRLISAMAWLGGYAIADVMVLALMAFYVSASGRAPVLPGAYAFAASALVTMLAYGWVNSPGSAAPARHTSLAARLAGVASQETPARR